MRDGPIIDVAVFAELQAAAGHAFIIELVQTFSEEAPTLLVELRRAQQAGAADRFRRAAHSLKSNCNTFGATRLAELARSLELNAMPADTAALELLEAEFAGTMSALTRLASEVVGG